MNKLMKVRESRGLTRKQLAKLSDLSVYTIASFERGQRKVDNCSFKIIMKLSLALGCKFSDIIENQEFVDYCKKRGF